MDGEKFYLYKFAGGPDQTDKTDDSIKTFRSTFQVPFFSRSCKAPTTAEYNDFYTELRWMIASRLNLRIYYLEEGNKIVHTSFCTPKSFKFPFMKKNDYHIGPCFTDAEYRGKGIYGRVLMHIVQELKKNPGCGEIYMIIEENNTASREGVRKAGFTEAAELYRKGRLKKYYVRQWL